MPNNLDLKRNSSVELKMNMDLPNLEIEPFSGDPLKYHSFVAIFSETVEKHCDEDGARLMRLLQYTCFKQACFKVQQRKQFVPVLLSAEKLDIEKHGTIFKSVLGTTTLCLKQ